MSGMQWKRGPRAPMHIKVIRQRNQNWPLKDEKELAKQKERKVSGKQRKQCVKETL